MPGFTAGHLLFSLSCSGLCCATEAFGVLELFMSQDSKSPLPLGPALDWSPRSFPPRVILTGRYCRLEPLDMTKHGDDLVAAYRDTDPDSWTYLFSGPFKNDNEVRAYLTEVAARATDVPYAIVDSVSGRALGMASFMRIDVANGVIEVGNIHYSDRLKRTRITTEAMFLMMRHVFDDLGYRRYEWKCNSFNAPSRKTAQRLGFRFEGIFKNHMVVKGHSRDTAWFAITIDEWPWVRVAYEAWLAPDNFDSAGAQLSPLLVSQSRIHSPA